VNDDEATIGFLHEAGHLKNTPRAGWQLAGIRAPESVAEHSFRVAVLAYVIATMEGCDAERAATIGVFHDVPEARTTDLHSVAKPWVRVEPDLDVAAEQVQRLPRAIASPIWTLIAEFTDKTTPEARCAKDADKLDCLLQAQEYAAAGNTQVQPWIDTMRDAMVTESGKRLTEAAMTAPANAWWHDIVASYGR
jgi:putative hydrolase of HD superfamily